MSSSDSTAKSACDISFLLHHIANTRQRKPTLLRNDLGQLFIQLVYAPLPSASEVNPLIATLKPQINGPSYSNTVIDTLADDGCYQM